jgi:hypothetical protein
MSGKIPVAILSDGGDPDDLIQYFKQDTFDPFVVTGKPGISPLEYEKHVVRAALMESSERSPTQYCILIKDTSITSFNPSQIELAVKEGLIGDLLYLTRWEDRCDLMMEVLDVDLPNDSFVKLVRIYSPKGFQSICISPKLRDNIRSGEFKYDKHIEFLFTDLIQKDKLSGYGYSPNLFDYNAYKYATELIEFQKLNMCSKPTKSSSSTGKAITAETYFYVTVIIAFFIAIGWGMYLLGPAPKNKKKDTTSPGGKKLNESEDKDFKNRLLKFDFFNDIFEGLK